MVHIWRRIQLIDPHLVSFNYEFALKLPNNDKMWLFYCGSFSVPWRVALKDKIIKANPHLKGSELQRKLITKETMAEALRLAPAITAYEPDEIDWDHQGACSGCFERPKAYYGDGKAIFDRASPITCEKNMIFKHAQEQGCAMFFRLRGSTNDKGGEKFELDNLLRKNYPVIKQHNGVYAANRLFKAMGIELMRTPEPLPLTPVQRVLNAYWNAYNAYNA